MPMLLLIVISTLLASVASALFAGVLLLLPAPARERLLPMLVSFAAGALLGAALLSILPDALAAYPRPAWIFFVVLVGILCFFALEKLITRHHAGRSGSGAKRAVGYLILIGSGIHNGVDGVIIASSFLSNVHLGIAISLAVGAHEIPRELGDFAVLL